MCSLLSLLFLDESLEELKRLTCRRMIRMCCDKGRKISTCRLHLRGRRWKEGLIESMTLNLGFDGWVEFAIWTRGRMYPDRDLHAQSMEVWKDTGCVIPTKIYMWHKWRMNDREALEVRLKKYKKVLGLEFKDISKAC